VNNGVDRQRKRWDYQDESWVFTFRIWNALSFLATWDVQGIRNRGGSGRLTLELRLDIPSLNIYGIGCGYENLVSSGGFFDSGNAGDTREAKQLSGIRAGERVMAAWAKVQIITGLSILRHNARVILPKQLTPLCLPNFHLFSNSTRRYSKSLHYFTGLLLFKNQPQFSQVPRRASSILPKFREGPSQFSPSSEKCYLNLWRRDLKVSEHTPLRKFAQWSPFLYGGIAGENLKR